MGTTGHEATAQHESSTHRALRVAGLLSSIAAAFTCVLAAVAMLILPAYVAEVLEQLGEPVPWVTLQWMGWPGKAAAGVCLLAAAAAVVASVRIKDVRLGVLIDILLGMMGLLAILVCVAALAWPAIRLIGQP